MVGARPWRSFDLTTFNTGDFFGAVSDKIASENISKVLYPNDEEIQGKQLRLEQQFFFVSCSLQHILRIHDHAGTAARRACTANLPIQLNDTHPAIAVAELMRLLIDEHAWTGIRPGTLRRIRFAYTNHTLLPEALEHGRVDLFGKLLPRHLEIILEINRRHFWTKFARSFRATIRGVQPHVAHRRERRTIRAHGAPGRRGQPCHQWSRCAAHRVAEEPRSARFLRTISGEV